MDGQQGEHSQADLPASETEARVVPPPTPASVRSDPAQVQDWLNLQIWSRVAAVARQSQSLLETERQRQNLKEKRWKQKLKIWQDIMLLLNFYIMLLLIASSALMIGIAIGINFPEGVVCRSQHSLCWHLRLRSIKQILK